jgi:hypothetical protein
MRSHSMTRASVTSAVTLHNLSRSLTEPQPLASVTSAVKPSVTSTDGVRNLNPWASKSTVTSTQEVLCRQMDL